MNFKLIGLVSVVLWSFSVSLAAAEVEVIYPTLNERPQSIVLTGTIEGVQQASLAAQQAGLVANIAVEAGDVVTKGQTLLTLDDTLAKLNLNQAKASLKAAKVRLVESERLYQEVVALSKQKVVAETLISQRRANVASSKAALAEQQASVAVSEEQLNRHIVYAPFNGVVAERAVNIGEWVAQSTPLFSLIDKQLRVRIAVPQQYFAQLTSVARGASVDSLDVQVAFDANGGSSLTGTLDRVVKAIDVKNRSFSAFVSIESTANIAAGMSATVTINLPQSAQPIAWLPVSAIKQHPDGGASIFTVENQKAKRVLVDVIAKRDNQIAVAGVAEKMAVVAGGVELLKSGTALTIKSSSN